jgi:hypothetical protein
MIKKNHLAYQVSLAGILILGFILIAITSPNKNLQMTLVVLMGVLYVFIGVAHHAINHSLAPKIVVEYTLIAAVGIAASFFVFKGI